MQHMRTHDPMHATRPPIRPDRRLDTLSDEELMTALQQGIPEALNVLQRRHGRRVYFFLLKYTRDPQAAEDLSQETFLRVYRSRHSYRRIARFTTWLFTIAANLARSAYRKQKRATIASIQSVQQTDGREWEIADESSVPDERVGQAMEVERVFRAIDRLPEHFREVVVMRGIQSLSYDEIHRLTGVPLGTIKSRIHRGRTMLGKMLEDRQAAPQ